MRDVFIGDHLLMYPYSRLVKSQKSYTSGEMQCIDMLWHNFVLHLKLTNRIQPIETTVFLLSCLFEDLF